MASLYKKPVFVADPRAGRKTKTKSKKWWGRYRDERGVERRVPLASDKTAAQTMLNALVVKEERKAAGIEDPFEKHRKRPLAQHIDDFRSHLANKGSTTDHVNLTEQRIRDLVDACGFKLMGDIAADRVQRYLAEARVVTGEIMSATVAEWRRPGSSCRGALVWFLRDLWPGAGWGLLDVTGRPKAAWWYFRRAAQPVTCAFTDEGVNGLAIHLYNDGPAPLAVQLDLTAWRNGEVEIARASVPILLAPRSAETHRMDAYFEGFHDFGHVYRFGPPGHDVLGATLHEAATGHRIATAVQLPLGLARHLEDDLGLAATLQKRADGWWACTVTTRRFAHAVHCDVPGWQPDDDYFALLPGQSQLVLLRPCSANAEPPQPRITALNGRRTIKPLVSELP